MFKLLSAINYIIPSPVVCDSRNTHTSELRRNLKWTLQGLIDRIVWSSSCMWSSSKASGEGAMWIRGQCNQCVDWGHTMVSICVWCLRPRKKKCCVALSDQHISKNEKIKKKIIRYEWAMHPLFVRLGVFSPFLFLFLFLFFFFFWEKGWNVHLNMYF